MRKYFILLLSVFIALTLNSCTKKDDPVSPTTSFWKQTDKAIWWSYRVESSIPGNVAWSAWESINPFPYGATYTKVLDGDQRTFTFTGEETMLTLVDVSAFWGKSTLVYDWHRLPTSMNADVLYDIAAQVTKVEGPDHAGGSIHITNFYKASETSYGWSVATGHMNDKTYGTVKASKPLDVTKPDQMAIRVNLSTSYAQIQFTSIYEWITE